MDEDFPIELKNDQTGEVTTITSKGSEVHKEETPADKGEKQTQTSEETPKEEAPSEEASKKESADTKKDSPKESKFDEDLDAWAEKAGHDKPETEKERKLLQKLRDSQREFTKDRQAKKSVDQIKSVIKTEEEAVGTKKTEESSEEPDKRLSLIEQRFQAEQTARLQSEFFTANSISEETSNIMAEILKEKVARASSPEAKQKVIDHWSHPDQLQDWYDLAKAREVNSTGKDEIVSEATQKERDRIAKEQKAGGVNRNAKSTVAKSPESDLEKLWNED